MTKRKKVILSLLFTGSFFLSCLALCGFTTGKVKSGVVANGLAVGGMSVKEAVKKVRENLAETLPPLTLVSPAERVEIAYPELSFTDDAEAVLRSAKKGESVAVRPVRQWVNAESRIQTLCDKNARLAVDAEVSFSSSGFTYKKGKAGLVCDYSKTLARVLDALKGDGREVELVTREYAPALTVDILKERTKRLSSYTTRFDPTKESRVHNIRLAARKLSGAVVPPHTEFSFNRRVGKRTAENGFKESVVIFDGEFVNGVGGGVCQLSTTLFNAALRAGMRITESRSHSLSVSYVQPSLDAMVSEYSDLKFVNPHDTPVYLNATVNGGSVTVECFGLPDGKRYTTESVVLYRLAPPPAETVEGEEDKILRAEKEGIASESYRLVYDGRGNLLKRELLRRDNYAVVRGKKQVKKQEEEKEQETQNENFEKSEFNGHPEGAERP